MVETKEEFDAKNEHLKKHISYINEDLRKHIKVHYDDALNPTNSQIQKQKDKILEEKRRNRSKTEHLPGDSNFSELGFNDKRLSNKEQFDAMEQAMVENIELGMDDRDRLEGVLSQEILDPTRELMAENNRILQEQKEVLLAVDNKNNEIV